MLGRPREPCGALSLCVASAGQPARALSLSLSLCVCRFPFEVLLYRDVGFFGPAGTGLTLLIDGLLPEGWCIGCMVYSAV